MDIDSLYEAQTNAMLDDIYKDIDDREEEGIDEDEESFDCDTEEAQHYGFIEDISLPQGFKFITVNGE